MYEIRQVIQRLRLGESDRDVARAQRVGRKTVARVRRQALERGWLDPKVPLPEDGELAEVFTPAPTNRSVSSAAPFREQILAWHGQGITAKAIHQALARKYRFTGSVPTIYRLLDRAVDLRPPGHGDPGFRGRRRREDRLRPGAAGRRPRDRLSTARSRRPGFSS